MRFGNNEEVVNFNGKTMITEKSNMIRLVDKKKKNYFLKKFNLIFNKCDCQESCSLVVGSSSILSLRSSFKIMNLR